MSKFRDGSIKQSAHNFNPDDYKHNSISYPVLGIVINVFVADNGINKSAIRSHSQRGSRCEAKVLVINDGSDTPWIIPNAVIPYGPTGSDDFSEHIPKPCTFMLDGSTYDASLAGINVEQLDGDFVIVSFIGGQITQPFIIGWWPHPGNISDAATGNNLKIGKNSGGGTSLLDQGRRFFKRYRGCKFIITDTGDIQIDTNESNALVKGTPTGLVRQASNTGGNIQVDVKSSQKLEINFNPPVVQSNPPQGTNNRSDDLSRMALTKDEVDVIAGRVVQIIAKSDMIKILAQSIVQIIGTNSGVDLGGSNLLPNQGVILGEAIDFSTGLTQFFLGNASTKVRAVK